MLRLVTFFYHILEAILDDLHTLTFDQVLSLNKPITKDEIYKTLFSILEGKSPGLDGLNVEFYKFFWDNLGDHLFAAINHFSLHNVMPKA